MMIKKHYNNPNELYNHINGAIAGTIDIPDKNALINAMERYKNEKFKHFTGQEYQYIINHKYGDENIVKKALDITAEFQDTIPQAKKTNTYDDQDGDTLDMERYLEGEERCFIKRVKRAGKNQRKIFKIYVMIGEGSRVPSDKIIYKTIAALKIIHAIEQRGDRAEVIMGYGATEFNLNKDNLEITMTIKRPEENLNLSLMAALLSPYYFRYWLLLVQYLISANVNSGQGTPKDLNAPADALYIGKGCCLSLDEAKKWISNQTI